MDQREYGSERVESQSAATTVAVRCRLLVCRLGREGLGILPLQDA